MGYRQDELERVQIEAARAQRDFYSKLEGLVPTMKQTLVAITELANSWKKPVGS